MADEEEERQFVSYEPLRAWIAEQEEYEQREGRPAPLTDAQRQALAVLVPSPVQLPARKTGEAVDIDYISLLMRYDAAHQSSHGPPEFRYESVQSGDTNSPRWRCRCRLPREAPGMLFPDINEERPQDSVFGRKKDAKQHAAYCAVQWLMGQHLMPSDGVSVTFPKKGPRQPVGANDGNGNRHASKESVGSAIGPPSPKASQSSTPPAKVPETEQSPKRLKTQSSSEKDAEVPQWSPPAQKQQPLSAPNIESMASYRPKAPIVSESRTAGKDHTSAAEDSPSKAIQTYSNRFIRSGNDDYEAISSVEQLAMVCQTFKFGQPKYELRNSRDGVQAVYSGQVVFPAATAKTKSITLPQGVGVVENIYTKKSTKERLAQSVLQYLQTTVLASTDT